MKIFKYKYLNFQNMYALYYDNLVILIHTWIICHTHGQAFLENTGAIISTHLQNKFFTC